MKFDQFILRELSIPLAMVKSLINVSDRLTVDVAGQRIEIEPANAEAAYLFNKTKIALFLMLKDRGPRFYRECYVKDREIRWAKSEGMMDFAHIFVEADGARWAVLRRSDGQYLLSDLWDAKTSEDQTHLSMGKGHLLATLDAAIAAAVLL